MERKQLGRALVLLSWFMGAAAFAEPPTGVPANAVAYDESGFRAGAAQLSPSEAAGREIWYKATAGNARFHTYVFQQRLGVLIDWYRVLQSPQREQRFKTWGLINDPSCCTPGSAGCPAKTLEETYGFDWCPGDQELLKYVGKTGYRDPACDFKDAPLEANDPHGPKDQRQSSCDLAFGTSTGAMGLRKFPNPKFNAQRWRAANHGQLGTWQGLDGKLSSDPKRSDAKLSHLSDPSLEPPFLVGMACGACHISFNPANPPKDPAHPAWENLRGAVGNQYTRMSEIMVSGMPSDSVEWQVFTHSRPGTTDTSAVPTDQVNNAGTMNALINIKQRPTFPGELVNKWRAVASCAAGENEQACWCEPGREHKCWRKSLQAETVHHILKDGGDSIGFHEALQRVYINIGSCSEQCWVNHLTDLRQLDPQQRNFGQTPFDIGQCRRDCPNFRAVEDRLPNVAAFLMSSEAYSTDLQMARAHERKLADPNAHYEYADLVDDLEREFGVGAVTRGKTVFADNCARCHSSTTSPLGNNDFRAVSTTTGLRADWMGNDKPTPASEVGTFRCRALHSNHMVGHIWEQYASETYHNRPPDAGIPDPSGGGRGYYRNISLLNLWAFAPFMHNNALGPEICGWGGQGQYEFYRSSYVDATQHLLPNPPACRPYDPSIEGRYALYKDSMRELLYPETRIAKITKLDEDIPVDIGPRLWDGQDEQKVFGFSLTVPKGANAGLLGNFQHKPFVIDLVQAKTKPALLEARLIKTYGPERGRAVADAMRGIASEIVTDPSQLLNAVKKRLPLLLSVYSSCTADVENGGHLFGTGLPDSDKQALIAFLATL
ncbi:MAG: cytochrome c [Gammaproteobacteria bacterium]